jgi:hypothetical protein
MKAKIVFLWIPEDPLLAPKFHWVHKFSKVKQIYSINKKIK